VALEKGMVKEYSKFIQKYYHAWVLRKTWHAMEPILQTLRILIILSALGE